MWAVSWGRWPTTHGVSQRLTSFSRHDHSHLPPPLHHQPPWLRHQSACWRLQCCALCYWSWLTANHFMQADSLQLFALMMMMTSSKKLKTPKTLFFHTLPCAKQENNWLKKSKLRPCWRQKHPENCLCVRQCAQTRGFFGVFSFFKTQSCLHVQSKWQCSVSCVPQRAQKCIPLTKCKSWLSRFWVDPKTSL